MTSKASNQRDITDVIKKQKREAKKLAGIARAQASGISGSDVAIASGQKTQAGGAGASNVTQDLLMNTYDIRDVDRLYFSTTAGSLDALATTDTGIESSSYYDSSSGNYINFGLKYQIPGSISGVSHSFRVGSIEVLDISDNNVEFYRPINLHSNTATGSYINGDMYYDGTDINAVVPAGTVNLTSGGGGSWVGTATSTLDMNNFNIEDVNILKINSGSANSADSFTMFGTSSAGALNLVDDTDFFDFQVDGDSKFRMYDDRIEINEPLKTIASNAPDIGELTFPFGTIYVTNLNSSSTLTVQSTSLQLGNISTNGMVKGFSGVIGLQCTDDSITKGTQGTVQIPELYNNAEPSASDLDGWFGNADGCIGLMRTASQTRLYARSGSTWKYEILS